MTSPSTFRSGFVAVIGRPNVGKSSLINQVLKQKVASVSPRPQTTRRRQLGIYTDGEMQIVFVDTPGIHQPLHRLGEYMNQVAEDALQDADVILWIVDASCAPLPEDILVAEFARRVSSPAPLVLVMNKIDLANPKMLDQRRQEYLNLAEIKQVFPVCAVSARGVPALMEQLRDLLPIALPYYDPDQVTDLYEKEIAADFVREAAMQLLEDELPHAVGVRVDEYHDIGDTRAEITATLFVERESQKPIVVGRAGSMIKSIGETSRREIEKMTGRKVHLDLRVKVRKNWRNDPAALKQFGFRLPDES